MLIEAAAAARQPLAIAYYLLHWGSGDHVTQARHRRDMVVAFETLLVETDGQHPCGQIAHRTSARSAEAHKGQLLPKGQRGCEQRIEGVQ
jgi:hypothetical protein